MPTKTSRFFLGSLPVPAQWGLLLLSMAAASQWLATAQVPAGRFLGPMIVAIAFAVAGCSVHLPKVIFQGGQGVIGLMAAKSITAAVLVSLAQAWPEMILATVCTIALSLAMGVGIARFGNMPGTTAIWGSAPGAAAAMISMGERDGADGRVVATMQYVRVVCVILVGALVSKVMGTSSGHAVLTTEAFQWPAFLGALVLIAAGIRFAERLPAGALLIPLILGAGLQLGGVMHITLPGWFTAPAMAAIGGYVGLRFDRVTVQYVLQRLPAMICASMILIAISAALAWGIAVSLGKDYLSVYLATSPGGLDSMAIIAVDSQADVSLVLAMQALRLFTVILLGPYLVRQVIFYMGKTSRRVDGAFDRER
jgi:membrane AbrB-like protein